MRFIRFALLPGLFLLNLVAFSQDRCGTVEYTRSLKGAENVQQFEEWLGRQRVTQRPTRQQRQQAGPYKVPVVVHVIHNGEALGTGTNISDAQILSQISVLNKDFRRLNADAINTPAQFTSVAGSMDIEFVLAKQDPEGITTSGIVRVNGNRPSWTSNDNYELKATSYWPAEDFLNIWVCNITDFLGYAQLPLSTLQGLQNESNNALTDGVVISHLVCGSIDDGPFNLEADYDKGRTLTHEMGHFFGLHHIWGDDSGGCGGTDYVNDTPNQAGSTNNCPVHPQNDSCGGVKMFQNFLDYTDDACMNLFTQEQVARMSFVIENSPRRASLLVSPGSQDPVPLPNDLGARTIVSPLSTSCSTTIVPVIEVRNYGSNAAASVRIRLSINGLEVETRDFALDNLAYLETAAVTFGSATLSPGSNQLTFQILQTNGVADSQSNNNTLAGSAFVPESIAAPFVENFNVMPPKWTIQNPDQLTTWQLKTATKDTPTNKALSLNFYDYEDKFGEVDVFLSPVFDLSAVPAASLTFDVAYATFQASNDRLKVIVLTNCEDILNGTVVYDKAGNTLSTTTATSQSFVPTSENQWRKEFVSISDFLGETHVQLAFVGINDWGNNLYLDNISLTVSTVEDLLLKGLQQPGPVTCNPVATPAIIVQNAGNISIDQFNIEYAVNGGAVQTINVTNASLQEDTELIFDIPQVLLQEGLNTLSVNLSQPNGITDQTPANNQKQFSIIVNGIKDRIPLRENFEQQYEDEWISINTASTAGMKWQNVSTNYGTSVYFNAFSNTNIGDEAWLVSPVLDFSKATTASVVFDVSYAMRLDREENLRLLVSTDCGDNYAELTSVSLSGFASSASSWTPVADEHWNKNIVVNLNSLLGEEDVRIAFAVINGNGNNLFLDNIEFFVTEDPNAAVINEIYSIYGYNEIVSQPSDLKITFNLPERQDVQFTVVDMTGRQHAHGMLTDVLNQTFPLDPERSLSSGIYIVRLKMGGRYYANRILVVR